MSPAGRYSSPIDRRILQALSSLQRRSPLRSGFSEHEIGAQLAASRPASGHRGSRPASAGASLADTLERLVAEGSVTRSEDGYRVAGTSPSLGAEMDERVAAMLGALRAGGVEPMPVETAARQAGVPPPVVDQVRQVGLLVTIGPRIEYSAETIAELRAAVAAVTDESGAIDKAALRRATGLSHRRADALVDWLREGR